MATEKEISKPQTLDGAGTKEPSKKKYLTGDQILLIEDLTYDEVYVPEWDTYVVIRGLKVAERDRWERLVRGELTKDERKLFGGMALTASHVRALIVQMAALTPDKTNRLWPSPQYVLQLANKSSAAMDLLFTRIIELSKVSEEDLEDNEAQLRANPTLR